MNPQYVYFAAACDKIKIGCSRRPHDRIWQVSEWIPFPIKLLATMPGGYDVETAIHSMFDADWSHGEWFNPSPRLGAFIDDVANGRPVTIEVEALATHRRTIIAEKKLITHRLHGLPAGAFTDELRSQYEDPQLKGKALPPELRTKMIGLLQTHGLWVLQ